MSEWFLFAVCVVFGCGLVGTTYAYVGARMDAEYFKRMMNLHRDYANGCEERFENLVAAMDKLIAARDIEQQRVTHKYVAFVRKDVN